MGEASRQIMRQARQQVPEWSPPQVQDALAHQHEAGRDHQDIVLVDVREKHEWNEGYIPGAVHVPRGFLELQIEEAVPDKSKTVVLYCAGGVLSHGRQHLAADGLQGCDFHVRWLWPVEGQRFSLCAATYFK